MTAAAAGSAGTKRKPGRRYWSQDVTKHSNALDLEPRVFAGTAEEIARSLKRSADSSARRKTTPFRSALSMLVFYENRAGQKLTPARRRVLEKAKDELRKLFGRPAGANRSTRRAPLNRDGAPAGRRPPRLTLVSVSVAPPPRAT